MNLSSMVMMTKMGVTVTGGRKEEDDKERER